ncbi:thioredoxin-like protein [Cokeromyces recurvatus]|uniref:thioredoxin-like protein n=1 Tax=Cokeromyces recurvatus TaxID=90255 RepID=UPI00221EC070|nr:thioredoxin-like protein [Cokeromyces recurvatus]KAI7906253.1 thioredoxin-like protein [Cokeromyces recurvatus]
MLRTTFHYIQRRAFHNTSRLLIAEGDRIPNVQLQLKSPGETIMTQDLFKGKKSILFGVPGAFTPGCSKSHLPGYIQHAKELKSKGIDLIACVSVNDAFVMNAWGEQYNLQDITLLADSKGELAKAMDLSFDASGALGGYRFKRFAAILDDDKIVKVFIEPNNTGLSVSLAENVLKNLSLQ